PPLPPGSAAPLPFAAAAGDAIAEPIAAPVEQAAAPAEESPIDAKYRELGGAAGTLGEPTGPELMLVDESGKFRTYAGGTIVWTPTLGTRVVDSSVVVQPAPAETDVVAG
ncbi:LGFP repeat-containing protein, partial [Prescottella equi]